VIPTKVATDTNSQKAKGSPSRQKDKILNGISNMKMGKTRKVAGKSIEEQPGQFLSFV